MQEQKEQNKYQTSPGLEVGDPLHHFVSGEIPGPKVFVGFHEQPPVELHPSRRETRDQCDNVEEDILRSVKPSRSFIPGHDFFQKLLRKRIPGKSRKKAVNGTGVIRRQDFFVLEPGVDKEFK